MSDRYYGSGVPFISYLLNNNKYLFVRYGLCLDVYDISKDLEFVNKNEFNFMEWEDHYAITNFQ